jgi:NADPH:quinone reductase-like Zn-dependent oxidoreductase
MRVLVGQSFGATPEEILSTLQIQRASTPRSRSGQVLITVYAAACHPPDLPDLRDQ